jgi:hypothetical protein
MMRFARIGARVPWWATWPMIVGLLIFHYLT